jgi:hypothetical protein
VDCGDEQWVSEGRQGVHILRWKRSEVLNQLLPEDLQRVGDLVVHGLETDVQYIGDFAVAFSLYSAHEKDSAASFAKIVVHNPNDLLFEFAQMKCFLRIVPSGRARIDYIVLILHSHIHPLEMVVHEVPADPQDEPIEWKGWLQIRSALPDPHECLLNDIVGKCLIINPVDGLSE